jgi:alpha-L-rhamnosidase
MNRLRIAFLFILSIVFNAGSNDVWAQIKWPPTSMQTKPWTRWWWQGSAVDTVNLGALMQKYKEAGLGGLEITPIYGVKGSEAKFVDYLSDQWVNLLTYTLKQAKTLNLGIDMATGTGWPFGGLWVTERDACKYMSWKTYSLQEGESLKESIQHLQEGFVRTANGKQLQLDQVLSPVTRNSDLQSLAIDQLRFKTELPLVLLMAYNNKGHSINLTKKLVNGKLDWVAPAGRWQLVAIFEGLHGKMVERAAPGGEGNVIDHFDQKALNNYLTKFDKALKGQDISGLRSFFNDSYEVDDARGQSNWTPDFFAEFKKRRGYDLEKVLPALIANDSSRLHQQVRYDYRNTVSDLLLDNFTKPWKSWAAANRKRKEPT